MLTPAKMLDKLTNLLFLVKISLDRHLALAAPTLIFATALQLDDFQSSHSIHHYH